MRPLVLLWGCLVLPGYGALVGPKEISGFEGDTVSLQCVYGEELKKYKKYWCRESGFLISRCSGTVYSGEYGQKGRVSVHDNPRQLRFEVILRNLTLKDVGQYWCGVKRMGFDKTFSVSLLVFPGISHQATRLDSTSTEDTGFVPIRSSSKPRASLPMTRMLAPVLVLLALLLVTGLAALGSYALQRRKKAHLATETQRKEKVHLSHLTSKEDEASWQTPEGDVTPGPPFPVSGGEPDISKFISV
ncbi:CMRF35-like molecule 9 isoform X3 [Physeter macrocephalus]|uniref:CMRF35-like molecule 9 isoform X3 n=1 Tax=Physeter macrocephalus TaxID=9755 RepID=A0A455C175_PHYMC|nr:CMRF35-like molecule 9 isoform X3 [Physeter catodon]|eukprot:XP_028355105.1 CMRF35-like molecule 9 isoform X3 [Physeter catodon]